MSRPEIRWLEDIVEAIDLISQYRSDSSADAGMVRDAIERRLTIIAEAVTHLSTETLVRHPHIDWAAIKGFRTKMVHKYFDLDLEITNDILKAHLSPLRDVAAAEIRLRRS